MRRTWLGIEPRDRYAVLVALARQEIAIERIVVLAEEHALAPDAALT
jgi:hypothetical protein